jgi:uncharacterized repeat protein (TIGR03803 family)
MAAAAPGDSYAASLTTLITFCAQVNCPDGAGPFSALIADPDGNLFGTTEGGGANGAGTVFEIVKTGGGHASAPTTLVAFCSLADCADGAYPYAGLIADAAGNLFGTTEGGGANGAGTVFEIVKTGGGYAAAPTTLVNFCSLADCADGAYPYAGLIADAAGNLFGTTKGGGAHGGGTVFEITKTAGYASAPTTLVNFCALANCADGANPLAGLILDGSGNLFGTTVAGGTGNNGGTAFEIVKTAGGYASAPTTLVSFCSLADCADGAYPYAVLIADPDGNLFGTTEGGGARVGGTVFEIAKTGDGYASAPTTLVSFCSLADCADGAYPYAGLIADTDGNLFGTTEGGGANGAGTVFEIFKTGGGYAAAPTTLVSFCSLANCADGAYTRAGLIADADGNLYGTTARGGTYNFDGTVFEITDSGFVDTVNFAGVPGKSNCRGQSVSALAGKYGGVDAAAAALGYSSVQVLQNAIAAYCSG